jgi:hypothetical protein
MPTSCCDSPMATYREHQKNQREHCEKKRKYRPDSSAACQITSRHDNAARVLQGINAMLIPVKALVKRPQKESREGSENDKQGDALENPSDCGFHSFYPPESTSGYVSS